MISKCQKNITYDSEYLNIMFSNFYEDKFKINHKLTGRRLEVF